MTEAKITSDELCRRLRIKYPAEAYAMLFEVRNGTGFQRDPRTADAIAMSLWPSRGLELIGFEIKTSRADWHRELADPSKAESLARYCDRWFVVISDKDIITPGELPETWGLMVAHRDGLKVLTEAPKLTSPAPVADRLMLASLLRAATKAALDNPAVEAEIERRVILKTREAEGMTARLERMQQLIDDFERDSGCKLGHWSHGDIGKAVRTVLHGDQELESARRRLANLHSFAKRIADDLERHMKDQGITE